MSTKFVKGIVEQNPRDFDHESDRNSRGHGRKSDRDSHGYGHRSGRYNGHRDHHSSSSSSQYESGDSYPSSSSDMEEMCEGRSDSTDPYSSSDSDGSCHEYMKRRRKRKSRRHRDYASKHGNSNGGVNGNRGLSKFAASMNDEEYTPSSNGSKRDNHSKGVKNKSPGFSLLARSNVDLGTELEDILGEPVRKYVDRPTYDITSESHKTVCVYAQSNDMIGNIDKLPYLDLRIPKLSEVIDSDDLVLLTGIKRICVKSDDGGTDMLYGVTVMAKRCPNEDYKPINMNNEECRIYGGNPKTKKTQEFHDIIQGCENHRHGKNYFKFPAVIENAAFPLYTRLVKLGDVRKAVAKMTNDDTKSLTKETIDIRVMSDLGRLILYGGGEKIMGIHLLDRRGNPVQPRYNEEQNQMMDRWQRIGDDDYIRLTKNEYRMWLSHVIPLIESLKSYFILPDHLIVRITPLHAGGFEHLYRPKKYVASQDADSLKLNIVEFKIQLMIGMVKKTKVNEGTCPKPDA